MGYRIEEVNDTVSTNDVGLGVSFATGERLFSPIFSTTEQTRENLKTLLLTRIGERYMQPNFGTNLLGLIFEPNNIELKPEIRNVIQQPINYWLPYVELQSIDITTAEDDAGDGADLAAITLKLLPFTSLNLMS